MKMKRNSTSLTNKKKIVLPALKLLRPNKFKSKANTLARNNLKVNKFIEQTIKNNETVLPFKKTKTKKSSLKSKNTHGFEVPEKIANIKTSQSSKMLGPKPAILLRNPVDNVGLCKGQLSLIKVTGAVAALLKLVKQNKTDLLALPDPIFMEVECIKIPICPTKQLKFKLPHPLVDELSDILLITADKKGSKIHPSKAVEHYTDLLAKQDINFIQKVIPLRSLREEYSQYEMRRKLVDQFDIILADVNIIKSLPSRLGKFILYKRKMPIPVHLNRANLKEHFLRSISKTQMTVKGTGHLSIVQVGHTKMSDSDVAENILAVAENLNSSFPGGWKNVRSLNIKTATSMPLPVYFSFASPNTVEVPVEEKKRSERVEDELSTMLGANVVVKASGDTRVVKARGRKHESLDDSEDDEILKEIKRAIEASKTVHPDDNSDNDGEAAIISMEKKVKETYSLANQDKEGSNEEQEEEEDRDDSNDEPEPIAPIVGQKRKKEHKKKQQPEKPTNKKQKLAPQQGKQKENNKKKEAKNSQVTKGPQKRGSRGGKKNKMNKHQRKAMLKRKKAGK